MEDRPAARGHLAGQRAAAGRLSIEISTSEDVDTRKEHRTETKYTTRCTIGAATPPRCDKPTKP